MDAKLSKMHTKNDIIWQYAGVITEKEAVQLQIEAGYHPAGYGFDSFKVNANGIASWACSNSCD